ncbi:MAG: NAD(+) synthase [Coprobacter sp.]|nr:NAD(+) synthase [Coprobacter sp.]
MNHGFINVAAAIPRVKVADCIFNSEQTIQMIRQAADKGMQIVAFPELGITGYSCGDLFGQDLLLDEAEKSLQKILDLTSDCPVLAVIGLPLRADNQLFNTAVIFQQGKILGVVPKTFLPNYHEFYEERWFASAADTEQKDISLCGQTVPFGSQLLFRCKTATIGIELCEDLWVPIPPSSTHCLNGADIIVNLSASNDLIGKHDYLKSLIKQQSARCITAYIYASAGLGESSTDVVFGGNGIIAENGEILAESERFCLEEQLICTEIDMERLRHDRQTCTSFMSGRKHDGNPYRDIRFDLPASETTQLSRKIAPHPFVPTDERILSERCEEIFNIQTSGLAKRILHTGAPAAVIGISGGLDSTLALLVCVKTFDKLGLSRKNIHGITMPGFGTTDRTYHNALNLMQELGISIREISIKEACIQHFQDIGHDISTHDVTYENSQARERTQLLMDIANQVNGLVIGTGDLSELALGWATYNGDHMSMYGVNGSIPKTLVRYLVRWVALHETDGKTRDTLSDIIDTPISPELIPADEQGNIRQKTEDLVGPYELHDFFLYYFLRFGFRPRKIFFLARQAFGEKYDKLTIQKWLGIFFRRFFSQQFKRSCLPDGPKVGSVSLSPRGDWRMPSDASSRIWLAECENL